MTKGKGQTTKTRPKAPAKPSAEAVAIAQAIKPPTFPERPWATVQDDIALAIAKAQDLIRYRLSLGVMMALWGDELARVAKLAPEDMAKLKAFMGGGLGVVEEAVRDARRKQG